MNLKAQSNTVPEEWLLDEDPNRRFAAAKSVIMNNPSNMEEAVGVLEELPNDASLMGARVRQALASFQSNVEDHFDTLFDLSEEDRREFVVAKLQEAVLSMRTPEADKDVLAQPPEVQKIHCDSTLREFGSFPRYNGRTSDAASVLAQFGEVGLRSMLDGVYDDDEEVRLVAITSISELLPTHFVSRLSEIASILDHWDSTIAVFVPRMLWLRGAPARIAIPKLESCFGHDSTTLAALSAKAVAILDPSRREKSLSVVEGLADNDDLFWVNLLAELRGEKPYLGV